MNEYEFKSNPGAMPCNGTKLVEVEFRNGQRITSVAVSFDWVKHGLISDILLWRTAA